MADRRWWRIELVAFVIGVLLLTPVAGAQDFAIDAQVDREEIAFGDALTLTISITQAFGNGTGQRLQAPRLDSIPGFDISSQRSAQNMTIVNGQGQILVQTILELVPQQQGEAVIPALSLRGPDGKMHSTKAIKVNVLPPPKQDAPPPSADGEDSPTASERTGMSFWQGILLVLVIIVVTVTLPVILSSVMQRTRRSQPKPDKPGATPAEIARDPALDRSVEDAQVVPPGEPRPPAQEGDQDRNLDFPLEVEKLKRLHTEAGIEFYRAFFDLFRRGLVGRHQRLHQKMTPDETVMILARTLPTEAAIALKRLAEEWDLVAFAGARPTRPFGQILEAALAVLKSIPAQERRR